MSQSLAFRPLLDENSRVGRRVRGHCTANDPGGGAAMSSRSHAAFHLVQAAARTAGLGQRTDAQLLADFLDRRDPHAFETLVRRHGPLVLSACRQVLRDESAAEDAFQATFIALYQRAATIRDRPSLAGWLFRVARRAATNARRAADRRARREGRTTRSATADPPDLSWREACAALHEELDRLPDQYRVPLITCYLQGLSRDEAARRLGWSLNEVRGRLERGRARLRARLQKRGITLSAGLLGSVCTVGIPAELMSATLAAARSSPIASPMCGIQWRGGVPFAVAVTVVICVSIQLRGVSARPGAEPTPTSAPNKDQAIAQAIVGRVIDSDGKSVADADVFVQPAGAKGKAGSPVKTNAEGRFSLPIPAPVADASVTVAATANGFAAGWATWDAKAPDDLTVELAVDDIPIRGRIFDLEGKPVAGVTVRVDATHALPDGGPKAYLEWTAGHRARPQLNSINGPPPGVAAEVQTDVEGRFRITGIGRDRAARLLVSGPGIAYEHVSVITVRELNPAPSARARLFRATFDFVTAPARPIRGVVRDADTGKAVAGVRVNAYAGATHVITDNDGRYELPGYKKGPRYVVYAWPPDGSTYFPGMAEATDRAGLDPIAIDITVRPGVRVTGRIRDAVTGKPVAAVLRYYALAGNTNVTSTSVGEKPGEFFALPAQTKADGTFQCAALPGRGVLAITADSLRYPSARVDRKALNGNAAMSADGVELLRISVGGAAISSISQESYKALVLLDVDKAKPPPEQRIELTPAEPVRGRFVDPDGKPLSGVRVRGLNQTDDDWSAPLRGDTFTAAPPHLERPRRLVFRHDGRKLVGTALVAAGSAKPTEFKLEPWASITGRLVDDERMPIARAHIHAPARIGLVNVRQGTVFTDTDGRFRIDGLVPGVACDLQFREPKPNGRGGPVTKVDGLKPGQERDLGELKVPSK